MRSRRRPVRPRDRFLPGETTHGHYQIELACNACHTEFMGVKQDACTSCHGEDFENATRIHIQQSKFNDPTNADRLAKLDAQKCITCHREHVPTRTHTMGLSLPQDYCFHCHQDVAEQRPSHAGMKHDSCATAGCHNYHDNRALYENFLYQNRDQPNVLDSPQVAVRNLIERWEQERDDPPRPLTSADADSPPDLKLPHIVRQWESTAHAAAGVNCRACHEVVSDDERVKEWRNKVGGETCKQCHEPESESFLKGKHGMRLDLELPPMQPAMARLPMHKGAGHLQLKLQCMSQAA